MYRCTTCVGHLGWLCTLNLHPRHQHCTDEAQKAETVLSAVIYIYIYIEREREIVLGKRKSGDDNVEGLQFLKPG